jgi:hypothetical protein
MDAALGEGLDERLDAQAKGGLLEVVGDDHDAGHAGNCRVGLGATPAGCNWCVD